MGISSSDHMISTLKLLQTRCLQAALNQATCNSAILVIRKNFLFYVGIMKSYVALPVEALYPSSAL